MSWRRVFVLFFLLLLLGGLIFGPDRSGLRSPDETARLLAQLGIRWAYPGPPVVLFFGPGCGDCAILQEQLATEGVPFELVDVAHTPHAREILAQLSRNRLGCHTEALTPTTIVGTCVIRGPNARAIIRAIVRQHNWPTPPAATPR